MTLLVEVPVSRKEKLAEVWNRKGFDGNVKNGSFDLPITQDVCEWTSAIGSRVSGYRADNKDAKPCAVITTFVFDRLQECFRTTNRGGIARLGGENRLTVPAFRPSLVSGLKSLRSDQKRS